MNGGAAREKEFVCPKRRGTIIGEGGGQAKQTGLPARRVRLGGARSGKFSRQNQTKKEGPKKKKRGKFVGVGWVQTV